MRDFPGGVDPLEQLFAVGLASDEDIKVATTIAGDLLRDASYQLISDYGYASLDGQRAINFSVIDNVENGINYSTVGIYCLDYESDSENPLISLEYDESGTMIDQTADADRSVNDNAALVEEIIKEIIETNGLYFEAEEPAIFERLLIYMQALQGKVEADSYVASTRLHMSDAIRSVASKKELDRTKISETGGVLACGTSVRVIGCEYLPYSSANDPNVSDLVKCQVEVKLPETRTVECLLEYHGGVIKHESFIPAEDSSEEDEDNYTQAQDEATEAGLFRPSQQAIDTITNSLIELSMQEHV